MAEALRADIQAARDRIRMRTGAGREFKKLESHLWERETVEMVCVGQYGRGQGLLALTNLRLLFIYHGIMGQTTEDFPLEKISSIQWSSGLALGTITIFASGNKAEVKSVNKDDGKAIVDRVRSIISGAHTAAQPSAPPAAPAAPPPPPPPPPKVPAGWYPAPDGAPAQRYWDGQRWTEHTAPLP